MSAFFGVSQRLLISCNIDFTGKSSIREMTELCTGISGNKEKKKIMLSIVYYVDLSL
ncbi:hypothetical protein Hdeb2414_s0003g00087761 [Helianthus debilis subsp. tardiflorus]